MNLDDPSPTTTVSWPFSIPVPLSPSFRILSPYPDHRYLRAAVACYSRLVLSERHRPLLPPSVNLSATAPPLAALTLSVADPSIPLRHGVDESYSLSISSSGSAAHLTAATAWGAMRGLETFSQLPWGSTPGSRSPIARFSPTAASSSTPPATSSPSPTSSAPFAP